MPRAKRKENREMESHWIRTDHEATPVSRSESHAPALKSESTPPDLRSCRILAREIRPATKLGNENHGGHPDQGKPDKEWKSAEVFDFATYSSRLTARRSAVSNRADRIRPCRPSMPPGGTEGQLNRAVAGPLQRLDSHPGPLLCLLHSE
jgi:hypothetical protein